MKNLLNLFILLVLTNLVLKGNVLTVDNKFPKLGQYVTLQSAIDAASDGDVIYIYPSQNAYSGAIISKRLTIIGNGWTDVDYGLNHTFISGSIVFNQGSDWSQLQSLAGFFNVDINASNITIKRNQLTNITVQANHTGTVIMQNFIKSYTNFLIWIDCNNDVRINNNFMENSNNGGGISACNSTLSIYNNLIYLNYFAQAGGWCPIQANPIAISFSNTQAFIEYNMITSGACSYANYKNNLSRDKQYKDQVYGGGCCCFDYWRDYNVLPVGDNNRNGVDLSTVFNASYHVIPGSLGSAENNNGTEIGIFGGLTPFVEGGYPDVPIIYQFEAANSATRQNGVKVKIKAKSNK